MLEAVFQMGMTPWSSRRISSAVLHAKVVGGHAGVEVSSLHCAPKALPTFADAEFTEVSGWGVPCGWLSLG